MPETEPAPLADNLAMARHTDPVTDADANSEPIEDVAHFPNGRVKFTGLRLRGEMHGAWRWYRTDGSVMRTGAFDSGRQIGPWRTFDRDGKLLKETAFPE